MILEEFSQSNSVFFDLVLNFVHQSSVVTGSSGEVNPFLSVGALSLSGGTVDGVLKAVGVAEEFGVFDCAIVVTVHFSYKCDLFVVQFEFKKSKDLLELLLRNFEVVVAIPILEETLGIESFLSDDVGETLKNSRNNFLFFCSRGRSSVVSVERCLSNLCFEVFLESLSSENFVDAVAECFPGNMLSSLRSFEISFELFKFWD
jgi:hypothetical protein